MKKYDSVDAYLTDQTEPARSSLQTVRKTIKKLVPEAEEGMWYGMPGFKLNGKPLAYYAAFKDHCSYFPTSSTVLPTLKSAVKPYKQGKGTLHFPPDKPLPEGLVKKLLAARMAEIK